MRAAARLLLRERLIVGDNRFADVVIWQLVNDFCSEVDEWSRR
jgi:hypothetical protein